MNETKTSLPALVRILAVKQQDVALDAQLDPATLCRALAGRQRLSPEAAARIERAILRRIGG